MLLTGDLGAGKTTFTQGLGEGLGVRGAVTSPTFVIARVHPSEVGGPPLVHVDAYRLGGLDELDDLDLDTSLDEAVTVVEWGEGLAEGLAESRLEVRITRGGSIDDESADRPGDRRRAAVGRLSALDEPLVGPPHRPAPRRAAATRAPARDRVLDHLLALDPAPDLLLVTGDVADHGYAEEYAAARAVLARWTGPLLVGTGNHDVRDAFADGLLDREADEPARPGARACRPPGS